MAEPTAATGTLCPSYKCIKEKEIGLDVIKLEICNQHPERACLRNKQDVKDRRPKGVCKLAFQMKIPSRDATAAGLPPVLPLNWVMSPAIGAYAPGQAAGVPAKREQGPGQG